MPRSSSLLGRPRPAAVFGVLFAMAAVLVLVLSACGGAAAPAADAATGAPAGTSASADVSFSKDVQPILQSRCVNCHGGQRTEKGLNMTSYDKLMAGSQNGPVIMAGDPNKSTLIQLVSQGKMPKSGPHLLPVQIQLLVNWVSAGAKNN